MIKTVFSSLEFLEIDFAKMNFVTMGFTKLHFLKTCCIAFAFYIFAKFIMSPIQNVDFLFLQIPKSFQSIFSFVGLAKSHGTGREGF